MSSLQAIISNGAGGGEAGVDDGGPALKPVVMIVMEEIGDADRDGGTGGFDRGEGCVIVHDVVGKQNFVAAAAAEIQRGEVIECAGRGNGGEQQVVFAIPETVPVRRSESALRGRIGRGGLIFRSIGRGLPGQRN